jgi:hypothetical protein
MKDNLESVVVEGHCKACDIYRPAAFRLDGYLQLANKGYPDGVRYIQCENCKRDDTLEFPLLI